MASTPSPLIGRPPAEVARNLGPGRNGRPIHPSSVIRWIVDSVRLSNGARLRLRASRLPGGWRINDDDLRDFVAAVTADRLSDTTLATPPSPVCESARRLRERARTSDKLDEFRIR
jgi:hypothetical protein